MQKQFDLIIYGATGFTGRLATQYMMNADRGKNLKIAIVGRDLKKLEALQQSCVIKPAIIIADSSHPESVEAVVQQTKVVLSFAGPFSLYGEPVIAACVKWGVDYLDITGETPFIHDMIKRYQHQAVESGARLIPFSGFDSVPADLTVYLALNAAQDRGLQLDDLRFYYQVKGGFNGGTLATAFHLAEFADKNVLQNANCLIPDLSWPKALPSSLSPHYEPALTRWSVPFFMNAINRAVVRRSAWLRAQQGEDSKPVQYEERMLMPNRLGFLKACLTTAFLAGFRLLSRYSLGRYFLKYFLPKPGEGPSATVRQQGFFRSQLVCRSQSVCKLIVSMKRQGDPGNEITVALACESARLAIENAFVIERKGFLTPTIAFGDQLKKRLEQAGFCFKTEFRE